MAYPKLFNAIRKLTYPAAMAWAFTGIMTAAEAQDGLQDQVWVFGNQAGVDFNTDPPGVFASMSGAHEGSASVSDRFGRLLFYTDGSFIYNRMHRLMPNGINVTGLSGSFSATHSTSQGAVIVPVTDHPGQYYIFSLSDNAITEAPDRGKLFYTVVDMSLDGGLGDVVTGRKGILLNTGLTEHMTSAPADNCDIWLMVVSRDWKLHSYRIPASGSIPAPVITDLLPPQNPDQWDLIGKIEVSPDGRWLAMARRSDLTLYRFDPSTGRVAPGGYISDVKQAHLPSEHYSVCFSHGSTKLYATNGDIRPGLYQFDLSAGSAAAIAASKTLLGMPVGGGIKRAPDGRIYFGSYRLSSLHAVHRPDEAGTAALFEEQVLPLAQGASASMGLPNIVVAPRLTVHGTHTVLSVPCQTSSHLLEAQTAGGWHHLWDNGDTAAFRMVTQPGVYRLEYRTPCSIHRDTFTIHFPSAFPPPEVNGPCREGDSDGFARIRMQPETVSEVGWFDAAGSLLSDSLYVGSLSAGAYTLHIRNTDGCDTTIRFSAAASGYRADFTPDSAVCVSADILFTHTGSSHFRNWHWNFGDGTTAQGERVVHSYSQPGIYEVVLTAGGERCSDTVRKQVEADMQNAPVPFIADKDQVCTGTEFNLFTDRRDDVIRLEWEIGNKRQDAAAADTITYRPGQGGLLPVSLTAYFRACPPETYSRSIMVTDPPDPEGLPQEAELPCTPGGMTELNASVENEEGGIYSYEWSTGAVTPAILVPEPGAYRVSIRSSEGCHTIREVVVKPGCSIHIPNIFTPDGNGLNDRFFRPSALGRGIIELDLKIFNRWGQQVYHTRNPSDEGWDGTRNGVRQPRGVYVYHIRLRYADGRAEEYQGNVTMLN